VRVADAGEPCRDTRQCANLQSEPNLSLQEWFRHAAATGQPDRVLRLRGVRRSQQADGTRPLRGGLGRLQRRWAAQIRAGLVIAFADGRCRRIMARASPVSSSRNGSMTGVPAAWSRVALETMNTPLGATAKASPPAGPNGRSEIVAAARSTWARWRSLSTCWLYIAITSA